MGLSIPLGGQIAKWVFSRRVRNYQHIQKKLHLQYQIQPTTPISGFDKQTQERIQKIHNRSPNNRLVRTSGTTGQPKSLSFDPARLRRFQINSALAGLWSFSHYGIQRADLFAMASLKDDDSFSSMVLNQKKKSPSYLRGLIYPNSYLRHPLLAPYLQRYGIDALRLWLMVICDVGMLYSTNPSTIAIFLQNIMRHWEKNTAMIRDWHHHIIPHHKLSGLIKRVASPQHPKQMKRIAEAQDPLPMDNITPRLQGYGCWDGGYVGSYLQQIQQYLPPERFVHLPMYSMSTESVQTLPFFYQGKAAFLPISPGVRYEFLDIDMPIRAENLLEGTALEEGKNYLMILSDAYGLLRYNTEDVFLCQQKILELPDLRFQRRIGLRWSFTGEKITGEQLLEAFSKLTEIFPALTSISLCCIPSQPRNNTLPHYKLLIPSSEIPQLPKTQIADEMDRILSDINNEFKGKRNSARLGPFQVQILNYSQLAAAIDTRTNNQSDKEQRSWESQFKLPPLVMKKWEEINWNKREEGVK